jgi:hypothetical protein
VLIAVPYQQRGREVQDIAFGDSRSGHFDEPKKEGIGQST